MYKRFYAMCLLGCLSAAGAQQPPFKSDKPPIPGVEVELRFSIATLDPLKPETGHLECVVRNNSAKAIEVPTVYTAGFSDQSMILWAKDRHPLTLHVWAGEKKQVFKPLQPKDALILFKADLKELLLLDMEKEKPLKAGEKRFYWSWQA